MTEVEYLGFRLSAQGVRMDPKKVEIIKQWSEQPTSKSDIRGFLGLVNYLKRFCKGLSHHLLYSVVGLLSLVGKIGVKSMYLQ